MSMVQHSHDLSAFAHSHTFADAGQRRREKGRCWG